MTSTLILICLPLYWGYALMCTVWLMRKVDSLSSNPWQLIYGLTSNASILVTAGIAIPALSGFVFNDIFLGTIMGIHLYRNAAYFSIRVESNVGSDNQRRIATVAAYVVAMITMLFEWIICLTALSNGLKV
jgi:hypothetical protein